MDRAVFWLLRQVTPEDLREALFGDLVELVSSSQLSGRGACLEAMRSIGPILLLRARSAMAALTPVDGLVLLASTTCFGLWEREIASSFSWPITRLFYHFSPASAAVTCMGTYVALYAVLSAAIFALTHLLRRTGMVSAWSKNLVRCALFVPPIVLLLQPMPLDSPVFRVVQLLAMLSAFAVMGALTQKPNARDLA